MEPIVSTTTFLLTALTVAVVVYFLYDKFRYKDVWAQHGVKQPYLSALGLVNPRSEAHAVLNKHGDTVGMNTPSLGRVLMTRDTALLKHILVKDFNNFPNRGQPMNTKCPVGDSVFFSNDYRWKRLRQITSPSFTTGKLKAISKTSVEDCAKVLADLCEACAKDGQMVPVKNLTSRFTSQIIARTAFGFNTHALTLDPEDDDFTKYSRTMVKMRGKLGTILLLILQAFPGLLAFLTRTLRIEYFDAIRGEAYKFFNAILERTISERKQYETASSPKPVDLLQSMVSTQFKDSKKEDGSNQSSSLTDWEIIGQSMLIAFAGHETTSSTLQMALYLLAAHPDIQEKAYQEILAKVHSDIPTHDELGQLKYLEQIVLETSRMYTIVPVITRQAKETRSYGDITIPKDTLVMVSTVSLHKDPKHWPEPDKFDPERFSDEAKANRDPLAFIPFGQGPRICIGMRLAVMELKAALACVLRRTRFELNENTVPRKGEELKVKTWLLPLNLEKSIKLACFQRK